MQSSYAAHFAALGIGAAIGYLLSNARATRKRAAMGAYEPLQKSELPSSPLDLLRDWIARDDSAVQFLVLATSTPSEGATARTVVLHGISPEGHLLVGTAVNSLKSRQLREDPRAEAVLRWGNRQCRVRGVMRQGTPEQCESCFRGQPPGAQIGIPWLDQGKPIDEAGHQALVARFQAVRAVGGAAPDRCPTNYVAFCLEPRSIEFYSGGHEGFLNDRWLYVAKPELSRDAWECLRLQA